MASTSAGDAGLLKFSVSSASSLIALQVLSRGFTFVLNQALFRLSTPATFGAASIQFELILSTILFLSREGIRNALLRVIPQTDQDSKVKSANLSFLPTLLGIPLALSTSILYPRYASQETKAQPGFHSAILLYTTAAMIELLAEPMYNLAMTSLKTNVRVRAEGLGITSKSLVTVLVLLYNSRSGQSELALRAFAVGQVAYSITLLATYAVLSGTEHAVPQASSSGSHLPWNHLNLEALRLSFSMTLQSLVKHFLTEGDKMVLSWFSPLRDQGGYAMAVNYGSLVARIVFQPIEETLRLFFSRTLNSRNKSDNFKSRCQAIDTLHSLLSVQLALSVVLVVFGSAYLPAVLPLVLPQQYLSTSAPSVLSAWVWYIPVLAVNGGLEAFLSSVASTGNLNAQSRWMVVFSGVYIFSAVCFYRLGFGDSSLVYANIINLAVRIVYCLRFTNRYFVDLRDPSTPRFRWSSTLPPVQLLVAAVLSAAVVHLSERSSKATSLAQMLGKAALLRPAFVVHIAIGAVLALFCIFTWWQTSGRHLNLPMLKRSKVE